MADNDAPAPNTPDAKILERLKKIDENTIPKSEFDSLGARCAALEASNSASERALAEMKANLRDRSLSLPGAEKEAKNYSFSRALFALGMTDPTMSEETVRSVMRRYAPLEQDIHEQTFKHNARAIADLNEIAMQRGERATNTTVTDSVGGFLVPTQMMQDKFYEIFYANLSAEQAGCTKLTGLIGDPVMIPKEVTGATAYMVPENSTTGLSAGEQTFGQMQLKPREAVATGSFSQRLLALSNPSIDALIMNGFMRKVARLADKQIYVGKNSNGEIRGILTAAGGTGNNPHLEGAIQDIGDLALANGATQTISQTNVIDFEGVIEDADALGGKMCIVTHPKVLRKFRKDTANQYTLPVPLNRSKVKEITGYDWITTTQLPVNLSKAGATNDGTLAHFILGNFEDLLFALWGGMQFRRSDAAYSPITSTSAFHSRLVHVLCSQLFDAGVIRSASFVASNEVNYT